MLEVKKGQVFKNYKELCNYLGVPVKSGKSKQLQTEDWNRYFESTKDGNKIIITKVYDTPKEKVNHRTGNNNKNIKPMIHYLQVKWNISDDEYYSLTTWFCNKLELLDKITCNAVYSGEDGINQFCNEHGLQNKELLCKYVSLAKAELKNMFVKALEYLHKKDMADFEDGYMFFYRLGKRSRGYVNTDLLNDIIKNNETIICNHMNEKYNLSDKLSGRQNLLVIYRNEAYTKYFNELKISMLMNNDKAIEILNDKLATQHETYIKDCGSICDDRPLIAYYRGIMIEVIDGDVEVTDYDVKGLGMEICNIIRQKVRKALSKQHYTNKRTGKIVYTFENAESMDNILKIEKLLFQYFDENLIDNIVTKIGDQSGEWLSLPSLSDIV